MISDDDHSGAPRFHYVYTLESVRNEIQIYTGRTSDLRRRLQEHNSGKVPHTAKFRPWRIRSATAFRDLQRAIAFERYLKSGSGRAFLHRHLEAIRLLYDTACADTGGSQAARNFLFWLAGQPDLTGFTGAGGMELRRLDREHRDAALEVLRWWSGRRCRRYYVEHPFPHRLDRPSEFRHESPEKPKSQWLNAR